MRPALVLTALLALLRAKPSIASAAFSGAFSNNQFSLELYSALGGEESLVVSPLSLLLALAMSYLGAKARTAEQLGSVLHLPQERGVAAAGFAAMLRHLDGAHLDVAARIYLQKGFGVKQAYLNATLQGFGVTAQELDFKDHEDARGVINEWVEHRTRGAVRQVIQPHVLGARTQMVLVSALYFRAHWRKGFNSALTQPGSFRVSRSKNTTVPMMHLTSAFHLKHDDGLGATVLDLPYENDVASMFILLPDDVEGLATLKERVLGMEWKGCFEDLKKDLVGLSLPRFRIENSLNLKKPLIELGLTDMFNQKAANFSGISGGEGIYITHVLQKAFVEVTEEGTEAGAASAVVGTSRSLVPPCPQLVVDRPFLFVLWDTAVNTALFVGQFTGPYKGQSLPT
ncbi:leukocyte elastase inhibitor-like [Periplaneta americana]|uniref:leukocyte elastase inhibitor-like n=1 Tax=Periplaneta americana TaxID=6978 RepID=UPI0037E9BE04